MKLEKWMEAIEDRLTRIEIQGNEEMVKKLINEVVDKIMHSPEIDHALSTVGKQLVFDAREKMEKIRSDSKTDKKK